MAEYSDPSLRRQNARNTAQGRPGGRSYDIPGRPLTPPRYYSPPPVRFTVAHSVASSRTSSTRGLPKKRSKSAWPPSPFCEDEQTALANEHRSFTPPSSSEDEPQLKGDVDQLPIIEDAGSKHEQNEHNDTLRANRMASGSNESTDDESDSGSESDESRTSRGDHNTPAPTPPGSAASNLDRRYVYIPKEGIEIPPTYDEAPRALDTPTLQAGFKENAQAHEIIDNPIRSREPSPYASGALSGSKRASKEYHQTPLSATSPQASIPASRPPLGSLRIPSTAPSPKGPGEYLSPVSSRNRAYSNSSGQRPERPSMARHVSAAPACSSPSVMTPKAQPQLRRPESDDSSSDSGSDSSYHRQRRRRGKSHNRRSYTSGGQLTPPSEDERNRAPLRAEKRATLPNSRPSTPPQRPQSPRAQSSPNSRSINAAGQKQPPRVSTSGSSTPMKVNLPQHFLNISATTVPLNLIPDQNLRQHEFQTHPYQASSRPQSPMTAIPPPQSKRPIPIPMSERPLESPREYGQPRSRNVSPIAGPSPQDPAFPRQAVPADESKLPTLPMRSRFRPVQPLEMPIHPRQRELSAPFLSPSSPIRPDAPQFRRSQSSTNTPNQFPPGVPFLRRTSDLPSSPTQPPNSAKLARPASRSPRSSLEFVNLNHQLVIPPPCPRREFVKGYTDWFSLIGCPDFDICPSCLHSVAMEGFADRFTPAAPRPPGYETRCDFGNPWIRMAWLVTIREKLGHLDLFTYLTSIHRTTPSCPGTDRGAPIRQWFGIYDPEREAPVKNFDICLACTRSLEVVFPALKGAFIPTSPPTPLQPVRTLDPSLRRTCDIRTDSEHFAALTDTLDVLSSAAMQRRSAPQLKPFVSLARKTASVTGLPCPRGEHLPNRMWHTLPAEREWTVCEECYETVVRPLAEEGWTVAGEVGGWSEWMDEGGSERGRKGRKCFLWRESDRREFEELCRMGGWERGGASGSGGEGSGTGGGGGGKERGRRRRY
ncbi:hypothetical protein MMC25_003512 [Agyrium rufum]|nr:hypothetical protein [Agyrium rufum]